MSEPELKYAAQRALEWMQGSLEMPELRPWIDTVVIDMLRVAIDHSEVTPSIPTPDKEFVFTPLQSEKQGA